MMRIPRFFLQQPLQCDTEITLAPELFRHAIQVLRLKAGAVLILFNGEGGEYLATLSAVNRRSAQAKITEFTPANRESKLDLTLVQSIIKPDKMDFAIQKSTELGVNHIQPLLSQRSVIRPGRDQLEKKQTHWQAVAISACEQSGRTNIPQVLPAQTLSSWLIGSQRDATRLILMPDAQPIIRQLQPTAPHSAQAFCVVIGPEGGFTAEEAEQCLHSGVQPVSLGPRILRAETAAMTVIALLQQQFGDL